MASALAVAIFSTNAFLLCKSFLLPERKLGGFPDSRHHSINITVPFTLVHLLFSKIFRILKKLLDISKISVIILTVPCDTEDLCNGSTPDSDSVCGGSNPSSPAR